MENLKKFITKKNLLIACMVGGVLAIILATTAMSISKSASLDLGSIISNINNLCTVYYFDFFLLIIITAGYIYRLAYIKDYSITTKVMAGANGIATLLALINFSTIQSIKAALGGNYGAAIGLSSTNPESFGQSVLFLIICQIVIGIGAVYLFFAKKDIQETVTTTNVDADGVETTTTTQPIHTEPTISVTERFKTYYATETGKRNVRIGAIVAGAIIILIGGFSIYSSMKRTPIDLTKSCKVTFEGVSGDGTANISCSTDYDQTDEKIKTFISGVSYSVKNDGSLKNGDTATIKAEYSEATADSSKVKVENPTKKVKVSGLEVAYKKFKDIPTKDSNKFEKAAQESLTDYINSRYGTFSSRTNTIDEINVIGIYYYYSENYHDGTAYYILRTKETIDSDSKTEKETNYYYVTFNDINSKEKLDLKVGSYDIDVSTITLYGDKTDANAIERVIKYQDNLEKVKLDTTKDVYVDEEIAK